MLPPLGYSVSPPLLISPSAFHPRSDLLLSQILATNSRATDESTVFIKLAASSWMKSPAVVGGARVVLLLHRCHLYAFIYRTVLIAYWGYVSKKFWMLWFMLRWFRLVFVGKQFFLKNPRNLNFSKQSIIILIQNFKQYIQILINNKSTLSRKCLFYQ